MRWHKRDVEVEVEVMVEVMVKVMVEVRSDVMPSQWFHRLSGTCSLPSSLLCLISSFVLMKLAQTSSWNSSLYK
jgi:hypothetical protein